MLTSALLSLALVDAPASLVLSGVTRRGDHYVLSAEVTSGIDAELWVAAQPIVAAIGARPVLPRDSANKTNWMWVGPMGSKPLRAGHARGLARLDAQAPVVARVAPSSSLKLQIQVPMEAAVNGGDRAVTIALGGYLRLPAVAQKWPIQFSAEVTLPVLLYGSASYTAAPPGILPGADFELWASAPLRFPLEPDTPLIGLRISGADGGGMRSDTGPEWSIEALAHFGDVTDADGDGLVNNQDNCPYAANPTQVDSDHDGYGDPCDPGDAIPPQVAITAPRDQAIFPVEASVTISVAASDADGTILAVRFFASGAFIGRDTSAPYEISWHPSVAGAYSLTAVAIDNDSASTTSAPIGIMVVEPPQSGAADQGPEHHER